MRTPKLSIVATLYRSAPYIGEFCARSGGAATQVVGDDYEIVLVNDGSPDHSLELAKSAADADPHIKVVDLSRNFGHHKAMMTGLIHADGERIFLIDSDLEEEPEWLIPFSAQMARDGCDVVYGVQAQRKGGWFERWSGQWYYRLFNAMSSLKLPANVTVARLMTRRYVEALIRHDEREVFMLALWTLTGYDQRPQTVTKHNSSPSTYSLGRKLSLVINSVTSFSNAPLYFIFYVGVSISVLAAAYLAFILIGWLTMTRTLEGWTSLIASIWFLGGLTISFIGVIGIYLAKVFSEAKRRPYTIVRETYSSLNTGNRDAK